MFAMIPFPLVADEIRKYFVRRHVAKKEELHVEKETLEQAA